MNQQHTPAPAATEPAPTFRRRTLRRLVAGVAAAAALISVAPTAPAMAGIPDAGVTDYLRDPMWTSITMNPAEPTDSGYQAWVQVDAALGGGTTRTWGAAPNVGSFSSGGGYIAATPTGKGLYFIDETGAMKQTGDATAAPTNIANVSGYRMNDGDSQFMNPITSLAITPSGKGGWVLDSIGEVWTFGDAKSYGSPRSSTYGDAADLVPTTTGKGYTIVTSTGDTYSYGDATSYGHPSFSNKKLPGTRQATGIALTPGDKGYWIVDSMGTVHPYGDAVDLGDNPNPGNTTGKESSDIAALPDGSGYAIVQGDGTVTTYSDIDAPAPAITSAKATVLRAGRPNTFKITATPGTRKITLDGTLPRGITFNPGRPNNKASLTGTPTAASAGTHTVTITARTGKGTLVDQQTLTLRVIPKR